MNLILEQIDKLLSSRPGEPYTLKGSLDCWILKFSNAAYLVDATGTVSEDPANRRYRQGLEVEVDPLTKALEQTDGDLTKLSLHELDKLQYNFERDTEEWNTILAAREAVAKRDAKDLTDFLSDLLGDPDQG